MSEEKNSQDVPEENAGPLKEGADPPKDDAETAAQPPASADESTPETKDAGEETPSPEQTEALAPKQEADNDGPLTEPGPVSPDAAGDPTPPPEPNPRKILDQLEKEAQVPPKEDEPAPEEAKGPEQGMGGQADQLISEAMRKLEDLIKEIREKKRAG